MRVRRSCQYFSGRSTVQSVYHRAFSTGHDSSSRRWVTLATGRPQFVRLGRVIIRRVSLVHPAWTPGGSGSSDSVASQPSRERAASADTASLPARGTAVAAWCFCAPAHPSLPASLAGGQHLAGWIPPIDNSVNSTNNLKSSGACLLPSSTRRFLCDEKHGHGSSLSDRFLTPVQFPISFVASTEPPGRGRHVVMAGTSRRPSSELGPDLSSPTPPKKSKFSESSIEDTSGKEHDLSAESVEKLANSLAASLSGKTIELIPGGETSPFEITEESLDSTKQLIQTSLEGPAKVTAGSSKEGHFGGFEAIVQMKYSEQEEHSGGSSKRSDGDSDVPIQASLLGEDALYQELSLIGNGAYGTVYKAKDLNTGQVVALKKVRVPLTEDGLPTSTLREIATLKQLERFEHPHIVRLLDVCQGNYLHLPSADGRSERADRGLTLWLVFEHVERDLASYMYSPPRRSIPSQMVKQMSKEILKGVEFLHSHRIIHRDLKPQNLLVSGDGRIKIADFGLAKTYDFEMRLTSVVVTQWYRAPEVLLGCSYATPVDIWSVGCIVAELCRLEALFPGTSEGDQLDRIFQVIGTPSQDEWPENVSLSWTAFPYRQKKPLAAIIPDLNEDGLDLVRSLIMFDPHSRLTAAQALRHRYFSEENS